MISTKLRPLLQRPSQAWLSPRKLQRQAQTRFASTVASSMPEENDERDRTILSGIQATGIPHLGNYFGALNRWVDLLRNRRTTDRTLFFIADYHALTSRPASDDLLRSRKESSVAVMAILGKDLTDTLTKSNSGALFCQSQVPAHTELNWILACHAPVGYLGRMTQWKSKMLDGNGQGGSGGNSADAALLSSLDPSAPPLPPTANLRLGLFAYPVLQAADVLIHRATHVPVGPDQAQHLEFARELAASFNHAVSRPGLLVEPTTLLGSFAAGGKNPEGPGAGAKQVVKIKSLSDPTKKMSKSSGPDKSRVLVTDSPELIRKKIGAAITDSVEGPITYDPVNRPGVANLIEMLALVRSHGDDNRGGSPGTADMADFARREVGELMTFKSLKSRIADELVAHLAPVRERYLELTETSRGQREAQDCFAKGGEKARISADKVMKEVLDAVGMNPL